MTRTLTTHVGSLPRSATVSDLLFARERGESLDMAGYAEAMTQATRATVAR